MELEYKERIINSREKWTELYEYYLRDELSLSGQTVRIDVQMRDEDGFELDVLEMAYFFPLADMLFARGCRMVELWIDTNILKKKDVRGRVSAFLTVQAWMWREKKLRIYLDNELISDNSPLNKPAKKVSHIFPLLCVERDNNEKPQAIFCRDLLRDCTAGVNGNVQLQYLYLQFNDLVGELTHSDSYIDLENKDFSNSKGTFEECLGSILLERLPGMSLLGALIFLYLLRELRDSEELRIKGNGTKGKDQWILREDKVEICWLDAQSYAEGIYQLIENSCLYSDGHNAYFGFRFHALRRGNGVDERLSQAQKTRLLHAKYKPCFLTKNQKASPKNLFTENYPYVAEFYVIDSAFNGNGIVPNYNGQHPKAKVSCIEDVMNSMPDSSDTVYYANDLAEHYGLHVFRRILEGNKGYVMVRSPSGDGRTDLYNGGWNDDDTSSDDERSSEDKKSYMTAYNILVPLSDEQEPKVELEQESAPIITSPEPNAEYNLICIRDAKLFPQHGAVVYYANKTDEVQRISCLLDKAAEGDASNGILAISLLCGDGNRTEILTKALFHYLASGNNKIRRIALCFDKDGRGVREFIHLVSVLYEKTTPLGEKKNTLSIMKDVQIAICTKDKDKNVSTSFLIAGQDMASAYVTAQTFMYLRFNTALDYAPQLKYLFCRRAGDGAGNSCAQPLFPFDLFLKKDAFGKVEQESLPCSPWQESLFLDQMKYTLSQDARARELGCKLDNLCVRFGSKLFVDCFYEAVLLFRNIGNNYRFAYLIACDLLRQIDRNKEEWNALQTVVFAGYEAYSSALLLQVYQWTKDALPNAKKHVCLLMAASHEEKALSELLHEPGNSASSTGQAAIVSLIPIGSTMSTVYKMREIVARHYHLSDDSLKESLANYCILVTNCFARKEKSEWNPATNNYWENCNLGDNTILVRPETRTGNNISVKYLLDTDSKWETQQGARLFAGDTSEPSLAKSTALFPKNKNYAPVRPVLQVDKSSTLLESVFPLRERNYKVLDQTKPKEMRKRFAHLFGNITYSHIYEGHNHYQFYIDNGKLFRESQDEIKKWLNGIKIDRSAFNVVVSPLAKSNVSFVKCVMDTVFSGSIRYLHIDINNALQEDFRQKYSFLADEYKRLRQKMPEASFHFYFVDEAIVSTRTIARAELLMRLLLAESNEAVPPKHIFSKIILLVNHSSYDTLNNHVTDPQDNVHAWINLNVPSYNTQADRCPACDLVDSYVLLRKRSSTQSISHVFDHLVDKHKKRTREEYDAWIREAILSEHSYYVWLKQWLLFDVDENVHKKTPIKSPDLIQLDPTLRERYVIAALRKFIEISGKQLYDDCFSSSEDTREPSECQKDYLNMLQSVSFRDVLKDKRFHDVLTDKELLGYGFDEVTEDDIVNLVRNYVIAKRDYMRLYCLDKAYSRLVYNYSSNCKSDAEEEQKVRTLILKMMSEELKLGASGRPESMSDYSNNAEWLISYIKILSRPHLVRHYPVQCAILNIMLDMLRIMMSSAKEDDNELKWQAERLIKENEEWGAIIRTLRCGEKICKEPDEPVRTADNNLCAALQYEIIMTLSHRLSVIQCDVACQQETLSAAIVGYDHLKDKYFGTGNYRYKKDCEKDRDQMLYFTEIPPARDVFRRYIKSVKAATMMTNNDDPCYKLAETAMAMTGD